MKMSQISDFVRGEGKVHSKKIISTLQVLSVKIFMCKILF